MAQNNGVHNMFCPLDDDWINYKTRLIKLAEKIESTDHGMEILKSHVGHLTKLDKLENIAASMLDIKDSLLEAATGKNQIDKETVQRLMKTQGYIFGLVILALTVILVFLLTGESSGWVGSLHR